MSVQCAAAASQKFTWPGFTAVVPALTVAVSVTTLPAFTEVTATPLEVTEREVVVVRANAGELIAAALTISATFISSEHRGAVRIDVDRSGEDMLLDPGPNCRFGKEKEMCAIELEEPKLLT